MDLKDSYKRMTNVDIDGVYHEFAKERAKGYEGEFQLFSHIMSSANINHFKVLMNLNIPSYKKEGKSTEIDLLLITEYGVLVFEVKNYKGTIIGNEDFFTWRQTFKTVTSKEFSNPLMQNNYHIDSLKNIYLTKYYSIVYFSSEECDASNVMFRGEDYFVATHKTIVDEINKITKTPPVLSPDQIEELFDKLKVYTDLSEDKDAFSSAGMLTLNQMLSSLQEDTHKKIKEYEKACSEKIAEKQKQFERDYLTLKRSNENLIAEKNIEHNKKLEFYRSKYEKDITNINRNHAVQKAQSDKELKEMTQKYSSTHAWLIGVIVIFVFVIFCGFEILSSSNKLEIGNKKYKEQLSSLQNYYADTVSKHNDLANKYKEQLNKYDDVVSKYNDIVDDYNVLVGKINPVSPEDIELSKDFVFIDRVTLKKNSHLEAMDIQMYINNTCDDASIRFNGTKMYVKLKDGSVEEYKANMKSYQCTAKNSSQTEVVTIPHKLNEIQWIKFSPVIVDPNDWKISDTKFEFEIYNCNSPDDFTSKITKYDPEIIS